MGSFEIETHPGHVDELRLRMRAGWQPKFVFFWSHKPVQPGVLGSECFSQWYPAAFEIEGVRYPTAEHYMMWSKAQLFGDDQAAAAVLAASSPGTAKQLGRGAQNFSEEIWVEHRSEIVLRASLAKFSQNGDLQAYLLGTHTRVLAEASPVDPVWGIGLASNDQRAVNPLLWPGLNLLGFALMEARARLGRSQTADG